MKGVTLLASVALLALYASALNIHHTGMRVHDHPKDSKKSSKDHGKSDKKESHHGSSSHEKIPICRKSMFSGVVGSKLIMYGGAAGGTAEEVGKARNDVVALTFDFNYANKTLESAQWETLDDTNSIGAKLRPEVGEHPLPGRYNGCSFVKDEKMYVFGGGIGIEEITNQLWEYDPNWNADGKTANGYSGWRKVFPKLKSFESEKLRRRSAVCGTYNGEFYIFSGRHPETSDTNQMYKINADGTTVTELVDLGLESKALAPSVRQGACGVIYKGFFFIQGGRTRIAHGVSDYNSDFWRFDLTKHTWAKIGDGQVPLPARNHHSCTVVGSKFYVFGGREDRDPNALRKDMWYTDLDNLLGPEQHLTKKLNATQAAAESLIEQHRRRKDEPSDEAAESSEEDALAAGEDAELSDEGTKALSRDLKPKEPKAEAKDEEADEEAPAPKTAEELLKERTAAYEPFMFASWTEARPKPGGVWPTKRFLPAFETLERKGKTYIILSAGQTLTPHAHVPDSVLAYTDHAIRLNDVWKFDPDTNEFTKMRDSSCKSS